MDMIGSDESDSAISCNILFSPILYYRIVQLPYNIDIRTLGLAMRTGSLYKFCTFHMCLVEKWLKGGEGVVFDDYECFGHKRTSVSWRAVIGSGGVGLLVKKLILRD